MLVGTKAESLTLRGHFGPLDLVRDRYGDDGHARGLRRRRRNVLPPLDTSCARSGEAEDAKGQPGDDEAGVQLLGGRRGRRFPRSMKQGR